MMNHKIDGSGKNMIVLWDEAIIEERPSESRTLNKYKLLSGSRSHLNLVAEARKNRTLATMGKMRSTRISCRNGPKRFSGRDGNYLEKTLRLGQRMANPAICLLVNCLNIDPEFAVLGQMQLRLPNNPGFKNRRGKVIRKKPFRGRLCMVQKFLQQKPSTC
jgi:hypothetical protein